MKPAENPGFLRLWSIPIPVLATGFLALVVSCDLTDPNDGWVEVMSILDSATIVVPETATVGVPFTIQMRTKGDGCYRVGPTAVNQTEGDALIEPRELLPSPPPQTCNLFPYSFEHQARLTFNHPGTVGVTIRGIMMRPQTGRADTVAFRYDVLVK